MPGVIVEGEAKARKPTKNEQRRARKKQNQRGVSAYANDYSGMHY